MGTQTLPPEVLDLILEAFLKLNPLRTAVKLRAVNKSFQSRIDNRILAQEQYFCNREEPVTYATEPIQQHLYNNKGLLSREIAARLIESKWYDDSFVHPDLKDFFLHLQAVIIDADVSYEDGIFRTRLCDLLARTSRLHIDPRSCQEAFFDYSSLVVKHMQESEADEVIGGRRTEAGKLQWLRQEAYSLATGICEPQVVQRLAYDGVLSTPGDAVFALGSRMANSLRRYWGTQTLGRIKTRIRGSPIEIGAICGRIDNLRCLIEQLEQGSKIQYHEESLQNGLELASENGHVEAVKLLLNVIVRHKMLNGYSQSEARAFEKACLDNHLDIAKLLQPFVSSEIGGYATPYIDTVLCSCVARGSKPSIIRYLVAKGASVNNVCAVPGFTNFQIRGQRPLHLAIRFGHLDLVHTLVDLGCNVPAPDLWQACFWPVYWDDCKMLNYLTDIGVEIYKEMSEAEPVTTDLALLPMASQRRCFGAVEFLLKHYPQVWKDGQALKAMEKTAEHTDTSMARLLLEYDAGVIEEKGAYAVFKATVACNKDLLTLLLERGVDTDQEFRYSLKASSTRSRRMTVSKSQDMTALAVAELEAGCKENSPEVRQKFDAIVRLLEECFADSSVGCTYVSETGYLLLPRTFPPAICRVKPNVYRRA